MFRFISALGAFSALLLASAHAETFANPPQFHTGTATLTLVTADINGDHIPDLVYFDANGIHILLGKGDGTFTPGPDIPTPPGVYGFITAADVNNDGRLDILMPGAPFDGFQTSPRLGVALQNADGTFQPMSVTTIPDAGFPLFNNSPGALTNVAVADINGDGNPDVVFGNGVTTTVYILFGDGAGNFKLQSTLSPGSSPGQAFAVDLNGDGHPDIMIHGPGNAIVFLNKGDGTFAPGFPVDPNSEIGEAAFLFQDINGDGIPDILTVSFWGGLNYFPGHSDGTFGSVVEIAQLNELLDFVPAAVADFNHDGIPDIALTSHDGIAIMLGQGGGKYSAPHFFNGASYPYLPAVADFNGDGNLDFAENAGDGIVFLFGNHDGTLQALSSFPQGDMLAAINVGDFNNDGKQDVAAIFATGYVRVAFGNGDGTLRSAQVFNTGDNSLPGVLISGHFYGTKFLDVLPNYFHSLGGIEKGDGTGVFDFYSIPPSFRLTGTDATAADFNHDGLTDLIVMDAPNVNFLTNTGQQSFTTSSLTPPGFDTGPIITAHFHSPSVVDAVSCNAYGADAITYNGSATGTFTIGQTLTTLGRCRDIAVGDFDGDGNQDIIILFEDPGNAQSFDLPIAQIFYGKGDGTFEAVVQQPLARGYLRVTAGDLNGDGIDDMVFTDQLGVAILHGDKSRTFGPEDHYVAGTSPYRPFIADMNGDGIPDLVFGNSDPQTFVSHFDLNGFHGDVANADTIVILLGQDPHAVKGTLTFSPEPSRPGQTFTMTAKFVASSAGSGNPTGSVAFSIDGNPPITVPLSHSIATTNGPLLSIGRHTITATYSGDSFFTKSTLTGDHIVETSLLATTAVLTASPNPAPVGQNVTFTATITSAGGTPAGQVNFFDGTTSLGAATLDANHKAVFNTTQLAVGTHTITARYPVSESFDTSFAIVQETITANTGTGDADFTITAAPTTQTGIRGFTAAYAITINPINGFNQPVTITCPTTMPDRTTCTMSPTAEINNGTGTTAVLLQTTPAHTTKSQSTAPLLPWSIGTWTTGTLVFAAIIFVRPRSRKLTLLILLSATILTGTGCGSPGDLGSKPGTYKMSITATSSTLSHSAPITLIIQ